MNPHNPQNSNSTPPSQGEDGPTLTEDDAQTPHLPPPPPPQPPIPYSGAPLSGVQQPLSQPTPTPPPSPPQPPETSDMPLQGAASDMPYTPQAQQDYAPYGNPPVPPPDQPLPPPPPPPPIPPQVPYPDSPSYQDYSPVDAGRYEQPVQAYPPSGYSTAGDYPASPQAWDSSPDYRIATAPPRGGIPIWAIIGPTVAVLLVGVGLLSWGLIGQGNSKSSRSTADATPTRAAQARTTIPIATLPSGRATATATTRTVVAPTATAIADDNAEATGRLLYASAILVFGPTSAELKHDPTSNTLKAHRAGLSLRDLVVEADFTNPFDTSRGTWDYGFMFRDTSDIEFRLIVTGKKYWYIKLRGKDASQSGNLPDLDTSLGGGNRLTLIAKGGRGYFFVNNIFIDTLDLSAKMDEGDVAVATGFFTGSELDGESTSVFNFSVGQLP